MTSQATHARMVTPGLQVVHVTVRDGYRPRTIDARSGVPLRVVFHRDEETPCSERVVFSSPHIDRHLAPHGDTVVELPPQAPGEVRFTCAMGRYRGRILLSDPRSPERSARRRLNLPGMLAALGGLLLIALSALALSSAVPLPGPVSWAAGLGGLLLVAWLVLARRRIDSAPGSQ